MSKKRIIISYRKIGDKIAPENMTEKEYINYLCHKFGFRISAGWDGIEKRHYRANWSEDKSYNIKTKDEALEFLGISKSAKAPDGIEKRHKKDRRSNKKDIRKHKLDRRSAKQRRQDDIKNHITYYANVFILFTVLLSWGAYSVYLYIEGLR